LDGSELLSEWKIAKCEVGFDGRFAEAGLQATDGSVLPPDDPAERARWLAQQRPPTARLDGAEREIDWRRWVISHAVLVRDFDTKVFVAGGGDEETGLLVAGVLIFSSTMIIDLVFQDIQVLAKDHGTVADSDGVFFVQDELPERLAHYYNGRFAHQFLVATVMITGRLSDDEWVPPGLGAEALALRVVVERARNLLVEHDIPDEQQARRLCNAL
jgi:hypothetical protein